MGILITPTKRDFRNITFLVAKSFLLGTTKSHKGEVMAHAAAHLKKARELEQHPEYRALQKARERRRRRREKAKRQVKSLQLNVFFIVEFMFRLAAL